MNTTKEPKITVVTVTYNAKDFLEDTIQSVINQTYKNIEYIIIDGASTDGTVDIIKKYEKYINYWVSEKDNGIFDAMNKAIDKATGEWINFMNAGDSYISKNALKNLFNLYNQQSDIILTDIELYDKDKTNIYPANLNNIFFNTPAFHQAQFLKTNLLKKFKYDTTYKIVCDYDLLINLYMQKYTFQVINKTFTKYLLGGESSKQAYFSMLEGLSVLHKYNIDFEIIKKSYWHKMYTTYSLEENKELCFSNIYNSYIRYLLNINKKYNKIAIYGYGDIGKIIEKVIDNIVVVFDKKFSTNNGKFYKIDMINNIEFDIIIVTTIRAEAEVIKFLKNNNISENKIISISKLKYFL